MTTVNIKGLAELEKALAELPDKLERNVVRGGLRAAAKVVADEAMRNVPVHRAELRDTIRFDVNKDKLLGLVAHVRAGPRKATKRKPADKRGWYAHMVEQGTKAHIIRAKKGKTLAIGGGLLKQVDHPGATAKPFMRPAFDSKAAAAVLAFGAYVKKRLTKEGINTPDLEPDGD